MKLLSTINVFLAVIVSAMPCQGSIAVIAGEKVSPPYDDPDSRHNSDPLDQETGLLHDGRVLKKKKKPKPPFVECHVTSQVSCVMANDPATACEDIVVPLGNCSTAEMTFTFNYCNTGTKYPVRFKKVDGEDLTIAKIETKSVNLDLTRLPAGSCHSVQETRIINTCKRFFSASLKVEALQVRVHDYCYGESQFRHDIKFHFAST